MSKIKTAIISSFTMILVAMAVSHADNLGIYQDCYTYKMSVVQDMETDTFIIEPLKNIKNDKIIASYQSDQSCVSKNGLLKTSLLKYSNNDCHVTIHFQFNSSIINQKEADKFTQKILKKCALDTAFTVTGYTCKIGTEKYNKTLSQRRAEAVAAMMKEHGFLTATVQGIGSQSPVTESVTEYYKNRRVEIQSE